MNRLLPLVVGCWLLCMVSLTAHPLVTEFMAVNADTLKDEDGAYSDWIEIENPTASPLNLAGYSLSDSAENFLKWTFPSRLLQPGERLVVFASGKNRVPAVGELHTNFSLNGTGESLFLSAPNGDLLQAYTNFPAQTDDHTYGVGRKSRQEVFVSSGASCRWLIPNANLVGWTALGFNDAAWQTGQTPIGYDTKTDGVIYNSLLGAGGDVKSLMFGIRSTCHYRKSFTGLPASQILELKLRMKYDDGYVAYLNETPIAVRNFAGSPTFSSIAFTFRPDNAAVVFEDVDITEFAHLISSGANMLAIHGLNTDATNRDFFLMPELVATVPDLATPLVEGYFSFPSPGKPQSDPVAGFLPEPEFSVSRGFKDQAFSLALTTSDSAAQIRYTLDGSLPTASLGQLYSGPISINGTTIVRAITLRSGWAASPVASHSYLFPAQVLQQPTLPPGYPNEWGTNVLAIVPADYQMDPAVVGNSAYAGMEQALRQTLPVISISADKNALFAPAGLYADNRKTDLELPASLEYFEPTSGVHFGQAFGLRIHGGQARDHAKKPFRLYFKRAYGRGKLNFPMFADSPVSEFDQLILRPGGHDGWASQGWGNQSTDLSHHAAYLRDQFLRKTELAMGRLSPHGKYVHVYLNGLYWGVYDLHERANAQFFASHEGGEETDWDVLHHRELTNQQYSLQDGTSAAWDSLQAQASAGVTDNESYQIMQQFLDLDAYIDHLIVLIWSGNFDWMKPIYFKDPNGTDYDVGVFDNKNWYTGRRSRGDPGKFLFFSWDAEMSMGNHAIKSTTTRPPSLPNPPPQQLVNLDSTRISGQGGPAWPYHAMRNYPAFRTRFADRLQRHFYNDGAMSTARNVARLQALETQLDGPIMAESARWGDALKNAPLNVTFTRDGHWRPEVNWLKNTFLTQRNELVISQFRAIGLFPFWEAPVFSQAGGGVPSSYPLTITHPNSGGGQLYFSLDGADPQTAGVVETTTLVNATSPAKFLIPTAAVSGWQGLADPASIATWTDGFAAVGFDADPANLYGPLIQTNLAAMQNGNPSVYVRIPFTLSAEDLASITSAKLQIKYDDGYQVFLNGVFLNRRNANISPQWNATASLARSDVDAMVFEDITLSLTQLRQGNNVLAFQFLNHTSADDDLLGVPQITITKVMPGAVASTAQLYTGAITLTQSTTVKARFRASNGSWSALTEGDFIVGTPASAANLVISEIQYHPAEPSPAEINAGYTNDREFEFIEVMNISSGPVELEGCYFSAGIEYAFPAETLAAGAKRIIAKNPAAFALRYPSASVPLGPFAANSQLANEGERITLRAANQSIIADVFYDDQSPWPAATDGAGYSLVLRNPLANPAASLPNSWRASVNLGGTPGASDADSFAAWAARNQVAIVPLLDSNADGVENLLEYLQGNGPDGSSTTDVISAPAELETDASFLLSFIQQKGTDDVTTEIEMTNDLTGLWVPANGSWLAPEDLGNGRERRKFNVTPAGPVPTRLFLRLRATLPAIP
jgi:hypothetical protein